MEPVLRSRTPMQRKAVAVEPRLQSSPASLSCWRCDSPNTTIPLCSGCGAIQDLPDGLDFFDLFQLSLTLSIDKLDLEKRFYDLSRRIHPDRFLENGKESAYSSRWATAVNRAYQTLRNRDRLSEYVLKRLSLAEGDKKGSVPIDLAEAYFELQDLLAVTPASQEVDRFRKMLESKKMENEKEWEEIRTHWDTRSSVENVASLRENLMEKRYLDSMIADLDKKGENLGNRRD